MEALKALRSADALRDGVSAASVGFSVFSGSRGNAQRLAVGQGVSSHLDQAG